MRSIFVNFYEKIGLNVTFYSGRKKTAYKRIRIKLNVPNYLRIREKSQEMDKLFNYKFNSVPYSKEHTLRRLQEYRSLRSQRIMNLVGTRANVQCQVDIREEFFESRNVKRAVIYLPSPGCEWAFWGPGCNMCGHYLAQGRAISSDLLVEAFVKEFQNIDWRLYPILNLYNNGSFFNENELLGDAMDRILSIINSVDDIRSVVIESRPEYITDEKMKHITQLLHYKRVEVAIGFESSTDIIRNLYLGKGIRLREFENAIAIVNRYGFSRAYVLLKPPFVSESFAIKDAIDSIIYAFNLGVHTVSLEPATIQEGTLLHYLWSLDEYLPPWLWSIVEVVKRTAHKGKVVTGMFQFYPSPLTVPYNCPECSDKILEAIREYNRTLSPACLNNLPSCNCYREWSSLLAAVEVS